jgi:hypothetical protein
MAINGTDASKCWLHVIVHYLCIVTHLLALDNALQPLDVVLVLRALSQSYELEGH